MESDMVKLLIGMRPKEKALEWFHSSTVYIRIPANELPGALRDMFYFPPNPITLRRPFDGRIWQKEETFPDYVSPKDNFGELHLNKRGGHSGIHYREDIGRLSMRCCACALIPIQKVFAVGVWANNLEGQQSHVSWAEGEIQRRSAKERKPWELE